MGINSITNEGHNNLCEGIIPNMGHSGEMSNDESFIQEDRNNTEQGTRKFNL